MVLWCYGELGLADLTSSGRRECYHGLCLSYWSFRFGQFQSTTTWWWLSFWLFSDCLSDGFSFFTGRCICRWCYRLDLTLSWISYYTAIEPFVLWIFRLLDGHRLLCDFSICGVYWLCSSWSSSRRVVLLLLPLIELHLSLFLFNPLEGLIAEVVLTKC